MNKRGQIINILSVLVIALILTTSISPSVYGDEPPLQGDITLMEKKAELRTVAYKIREDINILKTAKKIDGMFKDYDIKPVEIENSEKLEEDLEKQKEKFRSLIGMEYTNHSNFISWWFGNEKYLYWSEKKKMLLVDEKAKKENKVLHVYRYKYDSDVVKRSRRFKSLKNIGAYD